MLIFAPFIVAAAVTAAVPAPSPLPVIGRVRSKGFCSAVRENVAPALLGLMKSDEIVGAGHRAFAKMRSDAIAQSPQALDMDRIYLDRVARATAHNLIVVDKMLADERRFPRKPATDDERFADDVKARLLAVRDAQRRALDVISGTLETEALGRMKSERDTQMDASLAAKPSRGSTADPNAFIDVAGLNLPSPVSALDPRTLNVSSGIPGRTAYDRILGTLETRQAEIARVEAPAATTVTAAALACRDEAASPAPSPSPRSTGPG